MNQANADHHLDGQQIIVALSLQFLFECRQEQKGYNPFYFPEKCFWLIGQGINLRATEMQETASSFSAMAKEVLRISEKDKQSS